MKTFLTFFALLLAMTASAATRISLTITVTNVPVTGNSNTINASLRQWTNSSSSSTILTNLTSKNAAATNLFNNYADFPIGSGITHRMTGTNVVVFTAPLGVALSGSSVGGWASSVLSTQSGPSTFTALWPLENMVGETNRTNQGSSLVYGLGVYSTNAFATNSTALSNHITRGASPPQYIMSELRLAGNLNNGTGDLSVSNLVNSGNALRSAGSGGNSFQAGSNALARGDLSIAIGNGAVASNTTTMAIGTGAIATNDYNMAIGNGAIAGEGTDAMAIGRAATAYGPSTQAIGQGSIADGQASLAIQSEVTGTNSIGIGASSSVSANTSTALGYSASVVHNNSTAIGYSATTTTTNQVRLGTASETVSIPGVLAVAGTITNLTMRGTNAVNGSMAWTRYDLSTLANGNNISVPIGTNKFVRISGSLTAVASICGIIGGATSGGQNGQEINLLNDTGYTVTLAVNTSDPVPANRISTQDGSDVAILDDGWATLIYDSAASRWKIASTFPSTIENPTGSASVLTNIPHVMAESYYVSNTISTVSGGVGVWTIVTNLTPTLASMSSGFAVYTNSLVYTNAATLMLHMGSTLSYSQSAAGSRLLHFKFYKNGSPIRASEVLDDCGNGATESTAIHFMDMEAATNDRYQLYVLNEGTGDVTVKTFNVFAFGVK